MKVKVREKKSPIIEVIDSFLPCTAQYVGNKFFGMCSVNGLETSRESKDLCCTLYGDDTNGFVFKLSDIYGVSLLECGGLNVHFNDGSKIELLRI